jgi:hypothetical protein
MNEPRGTQLRSKFLLSQTKPCEEKPKSVSICWSLLRGAVIIAVIIISLARALACVRERTHVEEHVAGHKTKGHKEAK